MYCVHCGKELPGIGDFCPHCGARQAFRPGEQPKQDNSRVENSVIKENDGIQNLHGRKNSPYANAAKLDRRTFLKRMGIGIGAVAVAILVLFAIDRGMYHRSLKCPDPAVFFGLEWEDVPYDGSYDYYFNETAPSGMDAETAWAAMEAYASLLEQNGVEVSLEDGSGAYIGGDRYRLESDFGRYSLLDSGRRKMYIHYYPLEQRFFLTLPYGYDLDRIEAIPTEMYPGAVEGDSSTVSKEAVSEETLSSTEESEETVLEESSSVTEESEAVSDTPDKPADDPAPVITDTAVPDFQAFCKNNLYVYGVTEYSDYTEYCYFWKYNGKTMEEYLNLLQDVYHFELRGEYTISSINSYRYSFDYTGPGSAGTYDEDGMKGSDGKGISLYIWDLHASAQEGEVHISVADGLDYMDTGDRTTREVTPYQNASSSGSSNSGGEKDCWYCGGSGDCPTCDGTGTVYNWLPGTREYVQQDCTDCASPGKCRICGGSGKS